MSGALTLKGPEVVVLQPVAALVQQGALAQAQVLKLLLLLSNGLPRLSEQLGVVGVRMAQRLAERLRQVRFAGPRPRECLPLSCTKQGKLSLPRPPLALKFAVLSTARPSGFHQ